MTVKSTKQAESELVVALSTFLAHGRTVRSGEVLRASEAIVRERPQLFIAQGSTDEERAAAAAALRRRPEPSEHELRRREEQKARQRAVVEQRIAEHEAQLETLRSELERMQ